MEVQLPPAANLTQYLLSVKIILNPVGLSPAASAASSPCSSPSAVNAVAKLKLNLKATAALNYSGQPVSGVQESRSICRVELFNFDIDIIIDRYQYLMVVKAPPKILLTDSQSNESTRRQALVVFFSEYCVCHCKTIGELHRVPQCARVNKPQ